MSNWVCLCVCVCLVGFDLVYGFWFPACKKFLFKLFIMFFFLFPPLTELAKPFLSAICMGKI